MVVAEGYEPCQDCQQAKRLVSPDIRTGDSGEEPQWAGHLVLPNWVLLLIPPPLALAAPGGPRDRPWNAVNSAMTVWNVKSW